MKCPNCGHNVPYQSVEDRIAEWVEEYFQLKPPDDRFVEVTYGVKSFSWSRPEVVVTAHFWKNGDYKTKELSDLPAVISDTYEYKQAKERAWEEHYADHACHWEH